eukprot:TRINITY_DN2280_c0_g1_i2.p1 TRINITY_DN2280_c0_g1~~TRINITY_DN2280_c0_g1_i2.p1  ORF type:complete len:542 (-),score=126.68 TRINITY_DN2280_c0_g1_i2:79-1704(-)
MADREHHTAKKATAVGGALTPKHHRAAPAKTSPKGAAAVRTVVVKSCSSSSVASAATTNAGDASAHRHNGNNNNNSPHTTPHRRPHKEKHSSEQDLQAREDAVVRKEQELARREEALGKYEAGLKKRAEDLAIAEKNIKMPHIEAKNPVFNLPPLPDRPSSRAGVIRDCVGIPDLTENQQIEALKAFNALDTDRNGFVDSAELYSGLKMIFPELSKPEANRIYGHIDSNRDGTITFHEFLRAIVQYQWDVSMWKERQRITTSSDTYDWEIPHGEIKVIEKLGEGSYGVVYKAKWRSCVVAVKQLKTKEVDENFVQSFRHEIAILASLRHPNILLYMGASTHLPNLSICTEYLSGGSVYDLLHVRNTHLDPRMVLNLAKQAGLGLLYLHTLHPRIIHRDCKSENLLLDSHFSLKLCDFGLSVMEPVDGALRERVGSPLWMAPEMLMKQEYNEKADCYSFGVVLWEMMSGRVPFEEVTELPELIRRVVKCKERPPLPPQGSWPGEIVQLIVSCWDASPAARPAFKLIVPSIDRVRTQLHRDSS